MKKKDVVKLVKDIIKEMGNAYGSATLTTQGPPPTRAIRYTDEYPFTKRPKRTATGMMDEDALDDRAKKVYQAFINADKKGGTNFFKNVFKTLTGLDFNDIDLNDKNNNHAALLNKAAIDLKRAGDDIMTKEELMKKLKEDQFSIEYSGGKTDVIQMDPLTANKLKANSKVKNMYNIDKDQTLKGTQQEEKELEEEPNEISYDDAKKKGLENPDKADISKDKDISDYEFKRGMAIQKAMDDQEKNEELTNDVGKDDYVDDEGRYAKSQLYKMGKYAVKLHDMLNDMEQLPAWLQSKLTKASDYVSMVYHYLDYEFARRDGNLMEHIDKYNKRATLMEGAMKRFFKMFDEGMTDEEVVLDYAQKGTQVPETFVNKARKQYEGLKKMKLELEMSEKEYKNTSSNVAQPTPEITGMEDIEEKKLASGLTK